MAKKSVKKKTSTKKELSKSKTQPTFTVSVNPATLQKIAEVKNTNPKDIPQIFSQAREAQKVWASMPIFQRKRHILRMKNYIMKNIDHLAKVISDDNGKTRTDALITEVLPSALAAKWYAKNAQKFLRAKRIPMSSILFFNKKNKILRQPLGVVGIISPWNYPLSIPFGEIVMGLMAGNAIILKVAAATVMVGKAIEEIVAAGELPHGLFSHIVGSGSMVSTAMFANKIDKIFFTGSVPTGKLLMRQAAATLTPLSLELGGKDPMIVLADADLERAANGAAWAGYQNAGQSCGGVERVYVHEKVYEKFVSLLATKTKMIRHGSDENFDLEMGSMTTKNQMQTVAKHVKQAVRKGAKIIAQSTAVNNAKGYFYPATLMVNVDHTMDIMVEETFGPVIPVMKVFSVEQAIELANDSTMALTSSVWTKNLALAKRIAEKLESGVTTINDHLYTHGQSETPWGGGKESGLGRTHSALGLEEMTKVKVINWDLLPSRRNMWWYPFSRETYNALKAAVQFALSQNLLTRLTSSITMTRYMLRKMFTSWMN